MHLERFQLDDLWLIKPRWPQTYPKNALSVLHVDNGMALTAWEGNIAVGAAGITRWPLCDEGWAHLSDWFTSRPLVLHRLVSRFLPMYARYMGVKTLIARIEPGLKRYERWPEALNMEFKGYDADGFMQYWRKF